MRQGPDGEHDRAGTAADGDKTGRGKKGKARRQGGSARGCARSIWLARPGADRVIAEFYRHVAAADVAARSPRDLSGAALSLWRFAGRRRPGQAKVRVYNPDLAADGWASPHTIVEIVNDDMPFLVDSVTGAINAGGRVVHLVIHPVLRVARDADGRLGELLDRDAAGCANPGCRSRSPAKPTRPSLARLAEALAAVLVDVRAAVARLAADARRAARAARRARRSRPPPPVPPAELAEVQDFLRWLDDDNFTFLGFREYVFAGAAEPARPALGILRDPNYPVFGGLRDLSALPPDVQDFVRRRELLIITKSNRRATVHRSAHMDAIGIRRFDAAGEVVGDPAVPRAVHLARLQPQPARDPAAAPQGAPHRRARRAVADEP